MRKKRERERWRDKGREREREGKMDRMRGMERRIEERRDK